MGRNNKFGFRNYLNSTKTEQLILAHNMKNINNIINI